MLLSISNVFAASHLTVATSDIRAWPGQCIPIYIRVVDDGGAGIAGVMVESDAGEVVTNSQGEGRVTVQASVTPGALIYVDFWLPDVSGSNCHVTIETVRGSFTTQNVSNGVIDYRIEGAWEKADQSTSHPYAGHGEGYIDVGAGGNTVSLRCPLGSNNHILGKGLAISGSSVTMSISQQDWVGGFLTNAAAQYGTATVMTKFLATWKGETAPPSRMRINRMYQYSLQASACCTPAKNGQSAYGVVSVDATIPAGVASGEADRVSVSQTSIGHETAYSMTSTSPYTIKSTQPTEGGMCQKTEDVGASYSVLDSDVYTVSTISNTKVMDTNVDPQCLHPQGASISGDAQISYDVSFGPPSCD